MSITQIQDSTARASTAEGVSHDLHAKAILIRGVEKRLLDLFSEGKLFGTVHTCIGQEWTGIAVAESLVDGDILFTNHRGHGHFLARTGDVDGLIAEVMGKQLGHLRRPRRQPAHLLGAAFTATEFKAGSSRSRPASPSPSKLRGHGQHRGRLHRRRHPGRRGDLRDVQHRLEVGPAAPGRPENNRYAQSTPQTLTLAGDIEARAAAFGIETARADTWNPAGLLADRRPRIEIGQRDRGRPFFLRVDTYRLMAHSKGDDDRDQAEVRRLLGPRSRSTVFAREEPGSRRGDRSRDPRRRSTRPWRSPRRFLLRRTRPARVDRPGPSARAGRRP